MSRDPYYNEDGLPRKTDFQENGFGIDPEGCGCTDCLTGIAVHPSDRWRREIMIRTGRTIFNRTGHPVRLPNGHVLDDDEAWRPGMVQHHCPGCRCF